MSNVLLCRFEFLPSNPPCVYSPPRPAAIATNTRAVKASLELGAWFMSSSVEPLGKDVGTRNRVFVVEVKVADVAVTEVSV